MKRSACQFTRFFEAIALAVCVAAGVVLSQAKNGIAVPLFLVCIFLIIGIIATDHEWNP